MSASDQPRWTTLPTRRVVTDTMPGTVVTFIAFSGSLAATKRRPLDCRAITAVAVYALPVAVEAA